MILDYINWNINPEIFRIGSFAVRWYGLFFAFAFYAGYMIIKKIYKIEDITEEWLDKLTMYMVIGTVLGARVGHCLFYEPEYYLKYPIEILKIWKGGLASHGAAIGIFTALYLYAKKIKKPYLWILDRVAIVVALAGFFIRMGNLMNSEIYGVATNVPWAFIFVENIMAWKNNGAEAVYSQPSHPTQIYEALSYLVIFVFMQRIYFKKKMKLVGGEIFGIFMVTLFSMRFLIEFIKEDQVGFEQGMSLNMGQILSIPLILAGLIIFIWSEKVKREKLVEKK
jgi:prolipoprotein diacylglyceryl transferase